MRGRLLFIAIVVTLLGATANSGATQEELGPPPAQKSRDEVLSVARDLVAKVRYCALVTVGPDGKPRVRTMDPFLPLDDWSVWMGTNAASGKVAQIRGNGNVALYYFNPSDPGYVTLTGVARVVSDAHEKEQRWKPEWNPFYHDANHGDDYILIEFHPVKLEFVSSQMGLTTSVPLEPVDERIRLGP